MQLVVRRVPRYKPQFVRMKRPADALRRADSVKLTTQNHIWLSRGCYEKMTPKPSIRRTLRAMSQQPQISAGWRSSALPVNGCGGDVDEGVGFSEVVERPTYRPESPLASHSTRMWHVQKDYTRTGCQNDAGISDGSVPQCHNLRSCTMGMLSNQLGTSQRSWV